MAESELNRRQFGKRAAVTTAFGSLSLLGTSGTAQDQDKSQESTENQHPPAIAEPIPRLPIPVENLLLEVIRQTVPDRRLTNNVLDEIRNDIRNELRRAAALRSVKLHNGDEPAAGFAAYRAEEPRDQPVSEKRLED